MYLACEVRVTVSDSGLCCISVMSFKHKLTPLSVDSAWALWTLLSFGLFVQTTLEKVLRKGLSH